MRLYFSMFISVKIYKRMYMFLYIQFLQRNKTGPKVLPCGIPAFIFNYSFSNLTLLNMTKLCSHTNFDQNMFTVWVVEQCFRLRDLKTKYLFLISECSHIIQVGIQWKYSYISIFQRHSHFSDRQKLQTLVDKVIKWAKKWRLKLNEIKSTHINFTNVNPRPVLININLIPCAYTANYLGMTLIINLRKERTCVEAKEEMNIKYKKIYWLLYSNSDVNIYFVL